MGLGWRRIEMAVGAGALVVGTAALVIAASGLGTGTPPAAPAVHHDPPTTTTTAAPPAVATDPVAREHAGRHHPRRHPRLPDPWRALRHDGPGQLVRLPVHPAGHLDRAGMARRAAGPAPQRLHRLGTPERRDAREHAVRHRGQPGHDAPRRVRRRARRSSTSLPVSARPTTPHRRATTSSPCSTRPRAPATVPFVLVTSDHSDSITDWENSGDAIIGIHGPIDLLRRLADRHDRRRHLARLHPAARRRPGPALGHPGGDPTRDRRLSASGRRSGVCHRGSGSRPAPGSGRALRPARSRPGRARACVPSTSGGRRASSG